MKRRNKHQVANSDHIQMDKFQSLYETTNAILQSIFERARFDSQTSPFTIDIGLLEKNGDALDTVATLIRHIFNAESCGIYLVDWKCEKDNHDVVNWNKPTAISLVGTSNKVEKVYKRFKRDLHWLRRPKESLTIELSERVQTAKKPLIISLKDITNNDKKHFKHLKSTLHQLIAAPLYDRKGQYVGFFKIENKRDDSNKVANFTPLLDEALIISLSQTLQLVIELHFLHSSFMAIMGAESSKVLEVLLQQAVFLLKANRADFAICRNGILTYAAFHGKDHEVKEDQEVPNGFIRDTWNNVQLIQNRRIWNSKSNCRWAHNVNAYKAIGGHYHPAHTKTRSEIAITFGPENKPVGVLNVESFKPKRFNERDWELLTIIAQHAAVAVQTILAQEDESAAHDKERKRSRLYIQLINQLPKTMILQKDKHSRFILWNDAFRIYVGKSQEEMEKGCDDFSFFPEHLARQYQADDQSVMFNDYDCDVEQFGKYKIWYRRYPHENNVLKDRSRKERIMNVTKIRMTDEHGQAEGVQCIFEDVTKDIESETNRIYDINHRVLNHLNILLWDIDRGVDTLRNTIVGITHLHRLMYMEPADPSRIMLKELIGDVSKRLLALCKETSIMCNLEPFETISLDWRRAQGVCLIVVELITNTIKHAFPKGFSVQQSKEISITLQSIANSQLELTVKDNGCGFGAEEIKGERLGIKQTKQWAEGFLSGTMHPEPSQQGTTWKIIFKRS